MDVLLYKDFEIQAAPRQLADTEEWTVSIYIKRDQGGQIRRTNFTADERFKTRDEAVHHCFNFGKQIIDGKSGNRAVTDL